MARLSPQDQSALKAALKEADMHPAPGEAQAEAARTAWNAIGCGVKNFPAVLANGAISLGEALTFQAEPGAHSQGPVIVDGGGVAMFGSAPAAPKPAFGRVPEPCPYRNETAAEAARAPQAALGTGLAIAGAARFPKKPGAAPEAKAGAPALEAKAAVRQEAPGIKALGKAPDSAAAVRDIAASDLGPLLGKGKAKEVYAYGENQVIALLKSSRDLPDIYKELNLLDQIRGYGIPTVDAQLVTVDGKPAILMSRYAADSKQIVDYIGDFYQARIVGESTLLNQKSIADLQTIQNILKEKNISILDLQFLIASYGSVVVADPKHVYSGSSASLNPLAVIARKGSSRAIDLLIQQAEKQITPEN